MHNIDLSNWHPEHTDSCENLVIFPKTLEISVCPLLILRRSVNDNRVVGTGERKSVLVSLSELDGAKQGVKSGEGN